MTDKRSRPSESLSFDFDAAFPAPPAKPAPKSAPPSKVVEEPPPAHVVPVPVPAPALPPVPAKAAPTPPPILTVSQLGRILTRTLERNFSEAVWVEGEVTGARPAARSTSSSIARTSRPARSCS
jgi:hypothetical protein